MNDQNRLNAEVKDIWNQNADFWDKRMGEGNEWQKILLEPTTDRLLDLKPGEVVLDIACGNGLYARRLAQAGATVVAFDLAERLIEKARERTVEHSDRITYLVLDATDPAQLHTLGEGKFDAAVCTMGLMDMVDTKPLLTSLRRLLKPAGRFVFSVCHPCFNSGSVVKLTETSEKDGQVTTECSVKVSSYIEPATTRGLAMLGQPVPQYYFHRPLCVLLGTCFEAGLVVDALEEPVFPPGSRPDSPIHTPYERIPPVLVVRVRPC